MKETVDTKLSQFLNPNRKVSSPAACGGMNENKTIIVHTDVVRKRKDNFI
jgi:hypothetical protein